MLFIDSSIIWSVVKFVIWLIFCILITLLVVATIFGVGYVAVIVLGTLFSILILLLFAKGIEKVIFLQLMQV